MTVKLINSEMDVLGGIVRDGTWDLDTVTHAKWRARKDGVVLTAYESGKLVVQGKGEKEFVEFVLEPLVTGVLSERSGSVKSGAGDCSIALPWPHAGMDESGKGDYFGPLVVAAVFVPSEGAAAELELLGVKDSKMIKSDTRIAKVAAAIRKVVRGGASVVSVGPEAYNRLYEDIGNLNNLLAWGHARALENLLEREPSCGVALADKFGAESLIKNALMKRGRSVKLVQRVRGESDLAVAAASILARDRFVGDCAKLGEELGMALPKGASKKVEETAMEIVARFGAERLRQVAKLHFKTTGKVLSAVDRNKEGAS